MTIIISTHSYRGGAGNSNHTCSGMSKAATGPVIVDMNRVDCITSLGLRTILIIAKKLAPFGRQFVLFGPNPSVKDVLRVTGFLRIAQVFDSADEAPGLLRPDSRAGISLLHVAVPLTRRPATTIRTLTRR